MTSRRSLIALLGAMIAMLAMPAIASAAAPTGWMVTTLGLGNGTPEPSSCAALAVPTGGPDTTPPSDQTIAPPTGWSTTSLNVTLAATDDTAVAGFKWRIDGAPFVDAANGDTIPLTDPGVHTLETCVFDADGNYDGSTFTYRIDDNLPSDQTDSGTLAWTQTSRTVTVTGFDPTSGVHHVEWELDSQGVHSDPNNTAVPIVADGAHTLRTRVVDVAGNSSNWVDHTVRIDGTAPTDTTVGPGAWQTGPYTLAITGTDADSGVSQVDYKIDDGPENIVPTPATATISADGIHTVHTRVRDTAGNWSGWKDTTTVKVDKTAPTNQTPIGPGASVWIATDYAVVVSGADDGSGVQEVQWRVNGGPITSGPSGFTQATVTGTGPHTLETRVVDNAGNGTWRSETINIDKVAPSNTTTVPASAVPTPASIAIAGTDAHSGIHHVEWKVDGGPLQSTTDLANANATATLNGPHTLWSRVVDNAGNATERTDTFTINTSLNNDTTPPTDTTETVSSGWYVEPTTVTISASDAGVGMNAVQWRLPGNPIETRTGSSYDLEFNEEGVFKLETRGRDYAGNVSPWRLQIVRIDFTVPSDTTAFPTEWQTSRTFAWTATDELSKPASFEYLIDNGSLQTAAVGALIDFGTDGEHTIDHRVLDAAGQSSDWSGQQTVRIDTVDPANTSAVPNPAWSATAVSVALSGTDASPGSGFDTVEWRLGNSGTIQSGTTALIDTDGQFDLQTRAVDVAGRTSAWRHNPVKVDLTAPANTTPDAPEGWRSTPYTVTVAGDDGAGSGVATIDVKVDGATVAGPGVTVTGDGEHTIESRITDVVGRTSGWRTDTVRIDSVVPTATLTCPTGWKTGAVSCMPTADGGLSGLAGLTLAVDGGAATPVTSGQAAPVTTDGAHTLTLKAVDGAGNEKTVQAQVRVDRTAPAVSLACPAAAAPTGYVCQAAASDGLSGLSALSYSLNGGAWTPVPSNGTFAVASGTVRVRALDAAGNEGLTSVLTLPVRVPPVVTTPVTPRTASTPVYLAGRHNDDAMVGALVAARSATGTVSVDLRPLAVGRGRYQVVIVLKSGKHKRTVKKTYTVGRDGTLRRLSASLAGASDRTTVTLTVRKKHGRSWRKHAAAKVVLAK
jgi:hypothetical protein